MAASHARRPARYQQWLDADPDRESLAAVRPSHPAQPSRVDRALWFLLAAVPSALLLAVTQYMLRDIAPIPLLWVIPLALYLLTLTLSFGWSGWYFRPIWYALFVLSVYAMTRPL